MSTTATAAAPPAPGDPAGGASLTRPSWWVAGDWNAFVGGSPGTLGAPFSAGSRVYVQGWFRDPPSCKGTSLSNAVALTFAP